MGCMNKLIILGSLALASPVLAGGKEGALGVGAETQVNGEVGGVSVNYDAGPFHVGGVLGYARDRFGNGTGTTGPTASEFVIGARFFYHVHTAGQADFGVGGQIGLAEIPFQGTTGVDHHAHLFLEPGFQIRAFITPNVALSFTGGIVLGTVDANSVAITGQIDGIAGVHYYFY